MTILDTSSNKKVKTQASVITVLLLLSNIIVPTAFAQSITDSSNYASGIEQDSLLPPEVVPLDPTAANKLMQSQTQALTNQAAMSGAQTNIAAANNSINNTQASQPMGQQSLPQTVSTNQSYNSNMPIRQGQVSFNSTGVIGNTYKNQAQPISNNFGQTSQLSQSGWVQPVQAGSQTLAGNVNYQQQPGINNQHHGHGVLRTIGAVAGSLGSGIMMGALMRGMYGGYGMGMPMMGYGYGMPMMGYGYGRRFW